ncbi:MAG: aromatic ring-hydroxylating dioxygenase subunit alpha [Rhodospirillaceae bacterium]|nr:MAG: aromatic ring-hydroxylating dioxygenase subunit alpha [Rhodospirillaceae bacterium]
MNKQFEFDIADLAKPLTFPVEAYLSKEYAQAESERLWPKVWQMAGRVEEIPEVGSYITYDILDQSFLIVRVAPDQIKAFYNVCPHRGRQLVNTTDTVNRACGKRQRFVCGFHGWTFDLEGKNVYVLDPQDWKGALNEERTALTPVKVDTWGGWIFINMDPDCVSLREFLEPAAKVLDPFEFEKMRFKWRQWVIYPANWKTSLEAFMEPYHVAGTHSQLLKYGDYYAYSKAYGIHGVSGFDVRDPALRTRASTSNTRAGGLGTDPRISTYELAHENYETVNHSTTTETLVNAAKRLVDELPEGTPPDEVIKHWLARAKADDAARGVIWPTITPEQMTEAGLAWHLFPNVSILQGVTFALCYRTRPYGDDPNKCIFEAYAIERYPEGKEPKTEWVYAEPTAEKWGPVLAQDFSNMAYVQRGMKSRGFRGPLPNPHQERKVTNFHRVLSRYMGAGALSLLK